jgi:hypothetical protein
MRYTTIAFLLLSCAATASYAQVRNLFVSDLGNHSCGKYLAAVHGHPPGVGRVLKDSSEGQFSDDHHRYVAWLGGFFSATNWWVMDERNQVRIDNSAIDVWIRKWCEQNPTKFLIEAASAFAWDQRREYLQSWFDRQSR